MTDAIVGFVPGMLAVALGLSAALVLVRRLRHGQGAEVREDEGSLEELTSQEENLVAQLRDLASQRELLDPATFAADKLKLERQGVELLRRIDRCRERAASRATAGGAASARGALAPFLTRHPHLSGAIAGAAIAGLGLFGTTWLARDASAPQSTPEGTAARGESTEMGAIMARLSENPNDVQALARGAELMLQADRLPQARMLLDRALQIEPDDLVSRLQYAGLLAAEGDLQAALAHVDATLKKNPNESEAWLLRGMIARASGDGERVKESLARFVALAPEGPRKDEIVAALSQPAVPDPEPSEQRATRPPSVPPSADPNGPASTAAHTLWTERCALCHGGDGRAQTAMGRAMGIPDFQSRPWQQTTSDDQIRATIRDGVASERDGKKKRMPPGSDLNPAEIDALLGVVRSLGAAGR